MSEREAAFPFRRQRLAWRVYGPIDGTLIGLFRFFYRRNMYRVGYVFDALSQRYENWQFQRTWDRLQREKSSV